MLKKFLFALILGISVALSGSAQTQWYKATSYAYKYINSAGYWTDWTDWLNCNIDIKFNLDNDVITVYTREIQVYAIYQYDGIESDASGGSQLYYRVIDQDYDAGTLRLRMEGNGNSQIYVDFANITWVYNVRRVR